MKNIRIPAVCLCALLLSLTSLAQANDPVTKPDYSKPKLFTSLPDRIPVTIEQINSLLGVQVGATASLSIAETATQKFDGDVVSKANATENNFQSVVIRSSNFNGATLTLSKSIDKDGKATYSGRIISFKHGDVYELQNSDGRYTLVKRNFYDMVNE